MNTNLLNPCDFLPHSGTMLLIDKIIDSDYKNFITAERKVNKNDFYFDGHFPDHPIVPGVFIIEMMFQTCGILARLTNKNTENGTVSNTKHTGKAVKIKSAIFKKEVSPDSVIKITAKKKFNLMTFTEFKVNAYVGNEEVCDAELIISVRL